MNYRNAKHILNNRIDCEIEHPFFGWIPFTCDPNDLSAKFNTAELYNIMSNDINTLPYVYPTQEELDAIQANLIRETRDNILTGTIDPLVSNPLRWGELNAEKQAEWIAYRRALLDVPQQTGFQNQVVWPTKPS